ncbi:MAG: L-carnitine dehydratase/bile acid-inducible protein [Acidimicrobiales bacterium]|jgi:benzylsuccinate CoA-transferase BbsF subunit|nr:L-carnitine dehydratase/bile acid-inducible protein [Acidimicrobiales bacterium]
MGAEVIRVEDPVKEGSWDALRGMPPFVDDRRGRDLGGAFNNHNVEKLGVTLNLRTDRGKELLRELVAVSDVVTENFSADVLARLGFSYEELRAIKDDIIYVSNSGFGHAGPYRKFKTWGPIVQACCGLAFSTGIAGQPPAGIGFSYMDHHGASFMAIAILAALIHRDRTGEGQWIDISCTDAGALLTGPAILDYTVNDRPLRRPHSPDSNRSPSPQMAPHGIYPSAGEDNWIAIACRNDRDWRHMAALIGPDSAADERWTNLAGRVAAQDDLDRLIAEWTRSQGRDELAADLRRVGVPATAVQRPAERMDDDAGTLDWELWPTVTHREMGKVRVDGIPIHLSKTDWIIERGAPCLGEHNNDVFGGLLGHSNEELREMREAGVL